MSTQNKQNAFYSDLVASDNGGICVKCPSSGKFRAFEGTYVPIFCNCDEIVLFQIAETLRALNLFYLQQLIKVSVLRIDMVSALGSPLVIFHFFPIRLSVNYGILKMESS